MPGAFRPSPPLAVPTAAERICGSFMSSEWLQNNGMGAVLYRCRTWFTDAPPTIAIHTCRCGVRPAPNFIS
jgi:hypothetical protein